MSGAPLRMYTGLLGHGKTLKCIYDLLEEIAKDNELPFEKQRAFYTNIDGLKIQGVLPAPDDWRTVPDNSLIVYDEADLIDHYKASRTGDVQDVVRELKLARHRGVSVWFIVQSPSMLAAYIRRLIGEHIHIARPLGAEVAKVYHYPEVKDQPNDHLVKASAERVYLFKYPKHLFDFYQSVDSNAEHRQRFKMPENMIKGIFFAVSLILVCIYVGYQYFKTDPLHTEEKTDQPTETVKFDVKKDDKSFMPSAISDPSISSDVPADRLVSSQPSPSSDNSADNVAARPYNPLTGGNYDSADLAVAGAVMVKGKCQAFNIKAQNIPMSDSLCSDYLKSFGNMAKF